MYCLKGLLPFLLLAFIGCQGENAVITKYNCGHTFAGEKEGFLKFSTLDMQNVKENFISCPWTIEMKGDHKIALTIKELKLNINDSLVITEFFDERSDAELNNRKFYVLKPGSVIFSQSNRLRVEMIVKNGSEASFDAVFEDAECEEIITEERGEIKVPVFVHLSEGYHQCKWKLIAPAEKIVKLSFLQFNLAPGSCIFEGLTIKDGDFNGVLGDYCEENPPAGSLISTKNSMIVEFIKRPNFISNLATGVEKISMSYEWVDQCQSEIKGKFGTVSVPFTYSAFAPPQQSCQWDINVPEGHHISLTFLKYTTGPKTPGQYQEISIYDGANDNNNRNNIDTTNSKNSSRLLWSSNNSLLPPFSLLSESNNLRIVRTTAKSHLNSNGISFRAFFQAQLNTETWSDGCVNIGNRRFFQCSNGHYIDCDWRCDGIVDCADGIDEATCSVGNFEVVDEDNDATETNTIELLLMIALAGTAFAVFSLVMIVSKGVGDRFRGAVADSHDIQSKQYRYYVDLKDADLPTYNEVIDAETMRTDADLKAQGIVEENKTETGSNTCV